jgi:Shikimate kinase
MVRIFLIGYMGVGKTTAGKVLANSLGLDFIDLDQFIQNRYNKSVAQIFEEVGETGFRSIENKVLKEISEFENVVISTGGGAPCFYDNIKVMNDSGLTIYLKASPQLLANRLDTCKEKRPLIKDKNQEELFEFVTENLDKRTPFYEQAQIIFETEELVTKEDTVKYVSQLIDKIKAHKQI